MANGLGWPEGGLCLPPALAIKKQKIERAASTSLSEAGFSPIELPTLEYAPAEDAAGGADDRCKFVAPDGRLLGLRYDHTASLIRFIATQESFELPARLFYTGVVFRRQKLTGGIVEVAQIGAEILGGSGVETDIEIVRVLARTLRAVGLSDFHVDLGTVEVFKGIVDGTQIPADVLADIREAIHRKDSGALKMALGKSGLPDPKMRALESMPSWFGGREVFGLAESRVESDRSREGLGTLRRVYESLAVPESKCGLGERATVGLGVVQSLDYYTGAVFEAYARRIGQPIASGGRYDRLADAYGKAIAATGFALNVGLLL